MADSTCNPMTNTSANFASNNFSETIPNDGQADMSLDWVASAKDLDNQMNNDLANDAISQMIDTSEKHNTPAEVRMQDNHANEEIAAKDTESNPENFNSQVKVTDASIMPETRAGDKKILPKAHFIPDATTNIPDEETVIEVAETPVRRPSSLINRISGLWTSKPSGEKAQPESANGQEPAFDEVASKDQIAVSILDLSRPEVGNQDDKANPKQTQNLDDNELDIPAFLRRQAN